MHKRDIQKAMRGFVRGYWFNPATGEVRGRFMRPNQLSYACSDALAQLLGGNGDYAPKYIGFIYGEDAAPASLGDPTVRIQTWTGLGENMADIGGNIQISPLTLTPTITIDGNDDYYAGNSVVFSAHTRSGTAGSYGFPLVGDFADEFETGDYLYHAMLLTKLVGATVTYIPIARVTLAESGIFLAKPSGFELALDWQISFF